MLDKVWSSGGVTMPETEQSANSTANALGQATPQAEVVLPGDVYTRLMHPDQYKEWVRQTVSGHIWRRMTAVFSAVGLAMFVALATYLGTHVQNMIDAKMISASAGVEARLKVDAIPPAVASEIEVQIKKNDLQERITKQAVQEIRSNKMVETEIAALIVNQAESILRDDSQPAPLRELALQQLLLFGTNEQKQEAVHKIVLGGGTAREFDLAIQNYIAPNNRSAQARHLRSLITRAVYLNPGLSEAAFESIRRLLVDDGRVIAAFDAIRDAVLEDEKSVSGEALDRLSALLARRGGIAVADQFGKWLDLGSPRLMLVASNGLNRMDPIRINPNQTLQRQEVIRRITGSLDKLDLRSAYIDSIISSISNKDVHFLYLLSHSTLGNETLRDFLSTLAQVPGNRQSWSRATQLRSRDDLVRFARYNNDRAEVAARVLMVGMLSPLLDVNVESSDWNVLIEPELKTDVWARSRRINVLFHAWIQRAQREAHASEEILGQAAKLLMETHLRGDRSVVQNHLENYRYLVARAPDDLIRWFLEQASSSRNIGVDDDTILAEVFSRVLEFSALSRVQGRGPEGNAELLIRGLVEVILSRSHSRT
jgi:hypothetical protein